MREILFRGQTRRFGEKLKNMRGDPMPSNWVYGGIFPQNKGGNRAIIYQQDPEIKKYVVYADTVGQYTGLKDKNGVKIFEGDIVTLLGMRGKVKKECGAFGIVTNDTIDYDCLESKIAPITGCDNRPSFCGNDNFISFWELMWNYNQEDDCEVAEVIGNIHDNPELTKGE